MAFLVRHTFIQFRFSVFAYFLFGQPFLEGNECVTTTNTREDHSMYKLDYVFRPETFYQNCFTAKLPASWLLINEKNLLKLALGSDGQTA